MADPDDALQQHRSGGYSSEFDSDSDAGKSSNKKCPPPVKRSSNVAAAVATKETFHDEYRRDEGRRERFHVLSLDAYSRHKIYVNDYLRFYGGSKQAFKRDSSTDRTDYDVLRDNHKFLWDEDEDDLDSWEKRLAKKYYDKLFKEYCITDLSRYKENKIAMRWRIEKEVIKGKGQFECGNKKCQEAEGLRSWEVNFSYVEEGEKKNALVKLRLCPDCSRKLNYRQKRKEVKRAKHKRHREKSQEEAGSPTESTSQRNEEAGGADETTNSEISEDQPVEGATHKEVWKEPIRIEEDKSREEEFQEYFEDMFL